MEIDCGIEVCVVLHDRGMILCVVVPLMDVRTDHSSRRWCELSWICGHSQDCDDFIDGGDDVVLWHHL